MTSKNWSTEEQQSSSFAAHCAQHFEEKPSPKETRERMRFEVIWQGDPMSMMKTFSKLGCRLCMRERIETIKATCKDPTKVINTNLEIHGACRHNPHFHRCKGQKQTALMSESERVHLASCRESNEKEKTPIAFLNFGEQAPLSSQICEPCSKPGGD